MFNGAVLIVVTLDLDLFYGFVRLYYIYYEVAHKVHKK